MEFDIDKLADDIYKQILYVIHNQRQSSDETITDLYTYAGAFNDLTGIELNTNLFMQQEKINKYLIKYYQTSINDLLNFVNDNMVYLERLATNIFRLLDRNTAIYVYNSYYKYVNRTPDINYNDFKDIIYSFYSRYGNDIFSIVKKMFDEKRISMGAKNKLKSDGYTISSPYTKDVFIVLSIENFGIDSLILLVHELGHAISNYISVVGYNDKKTYMSPYREVPSTYFEIPFMDYLMQSKIFPDSALTQLNDKFINELNSLHRYVGVFRHPEEKSIAVDIDGNISKTIKDKNLKGKPFYEDIMYTIGYSVALNAYLTYGDDYQEYAKRIIDFMYYYKKFTFKENIESLGLNYKKYISCNTIAPYVKEKNQELIRKQLTKNKI